MDHEHSHSKEQNVHHKKDLVRPLKINLQNNLFCHSQYKLSKNNYSTRFVGNWNTGIGQGGPVFEPGCSIEQVDIRIANTLHSDPIQSSALSTMLNETTIECPKSSTQSRPHPLCLQ